MPLQSGDRLGPYEIRTLVGAGGMGEVYRATDTRLGRDVAIKILAPALGADAAALARFAREARAVASLNHPNILAIFDVGHEGPTAYAVTELLDGQTLGERLRGGALPPRKVADVAIQIAAGLAAAHDRGIVHRDLKPANLFVTTDGRVKVLDFGVAAVTPAVVSAEGETVAGGPAAPATSPGMVVGSLGYMAPEQVRGAAVDHRTDIFALGCVLYEMLSGRRAFEGGTAADTLAAVLDKEPDPIPAAASGASSLATMARIARRCLEKSPIERFQSARDVGFALEMARDETSTGERPSPQPARRWRRAAALTAAAAAAGATAVLVLTRADSSSLIADRQQAVRFLIPASVTWSDGATVSPDGAYVVYTSAATPGASGRLWWRRLDALTADAIPDTLTAAPAFFWSPDGRQLGYSQGNALIAREMPGGALRHIAELPEAAQSIAWGARGQLVVAMGGALYRLAASGGTPELLMAAAPDRAVWRAAPAFLPDGDRFLFTVLTSGVGEHALETRVGTLDGRELTTVARGIVAAMYADGYLIFGSGRSLYAQPFDADTLALSGERVRLADDVALDWRSGRHIASVSNTGVLVIRGTSASVAQFKLVDRNGRPLRDIGSPGPFTNFSVAPDGRRLMVTRQDRDTGRLSLWLIDITRGTTSPAMGPENPDNADDPTWTPDGTQVAYRYGPRLVVRGAHGGTARTLLAAEAFPDTFSPDGRFLIYGRSRGNFFEQWALDVTSPGADPMPLVTGITLADETRLSPDGRWLAYHSNETGTAQVSVMPFPPTGEKWQISTAGGVQPRWSRDGREVYYLESDGRLMVVTIPGSDPRLASAPQMLFATGFAPSDALDQYEPVRDGFIVRMPATSATSDTSVQVIANWRALLAPSAR